MPAPQELMDRLSAANPVREPGPLSADRQRDADALLERLLAVPVEPAAPRGARLPRRWPRLALGTAVAAVAVFAVLNLLDSEEGPAPNVLAQAVAALTRPDVIYHAEIIGTGRSSDMPEEGTIVTRYETWHTADGRMRQRSYVTKHGRKTRSYGEIAGQRRPGRLGGPALRYDAFSNTIVESGFGRSGSGHGAPGVDPFDPGRSLRELQAEGRLRLAGRAVVEGRPAYRLVSGDVRDADGRIQRTELLVDAKTYLPREQRFFLRGKDLKQSLRWRYVVYERLPLNEKTEPLLHLHSPRGAKCSPFADEVESERRGSLGYPNPCAG
jgi:hypothetical protein